MDDPFDPDNHTAYTRWRKEKLASAPLTSSELIVEINDPRALSASEHAALLDRIKRCNMVVYASNVLDEDNGIPRDLAAQFGLKHLDANWLADEDGISEIKVNSNGTRQSYIPYTDRPIKWHTDGYYNTPERKIRSMLLHCVRSAKQGGENHLMDHEIAYLLLRDENPDFIRALTQSDAMTIPERVDDQDGVRSVQTGPVFSTNADGSLHMRYTARTRSIEWKQDDMTRSAVAALEKLLATATEHIYQARLEPGMGLLCNNVLHDRAAFEDDATTPRLLFRARYYERIAAS